MRLPTSPSYPLLGHVEQQPSVRPAHPAPEPLVLKAQSLPFCRQDWTLDRCGQQPASQAVRRRASRKVPSAEPAGATRAQVCCEREPGIGHPSERTMPRTMNQRAPHQATGLVRSSSCVRQAAGRVIRSMNCWAAGWPGPAARPRSPAERAARVEMWPVLGSSPRAAPLRCQGAVLQSAHSPARHGPGPRKWPSGTQPRPHDAVLGPRATARRERTGSGLPRCWRSPRRCLRAA